jgi:hypothetical protein
MPPCHGDILGSSNENGCGGSAALRAQRCVPVEHRAKKWVPVFRTSYRPFGQNLSGGQILGEKATRAVLEWRQTMRPRKDWGTRSDVFGTLRARQVFGREGRTGQRPSHIRRTPVQTGKIDMSECGTGGETEMVVRRLHRPIFSSAGAERALPETESTSPGAHRRPFRLAAIGARRCGVRFDANQKNAGGCHPPGGNPGCRYER